MTRLTLACITCLLISPASLLWGHDPETERRFGVQAVGATQTFADLYRFLPGEGTVLQRGELCIGGAETPITVTRLIPETRTRTITTYEVVVESGRPRVVPKQTVVEYTVYRLVSERTTLTSPTIKGEWGAIDFPNATGWLFFAQEGAGLALGLGATVNDQLQGFALYLNFGQVPSGYYGLLGSLENGMVE